MAEDNVLQTRITEIGRRMLEQARANEADASPLVRQMRGFIRQLARDDVFRVQALRLIDVLPAIADDQSLASHVEAYFGGHDFPLPELIRWGAEHASVAPALLSPAIRQGVR